MASELTLNASMVFDDSDIPDPLTLSVTDKTITLTTVMAVYNKQLIATSETTINLGGIGTLGYVIFVNMDDTNYIEIKTAASGTIIGKLFPGELMFFRVGSGITAPVAIANTAQCRMATLICAT